MCPILDLSGVAKPIGKGRYEIRVKEASEGAGKESGDPYFRIQLETDDGQYICSDIIMLAGRGAGMGRAKLKGLGIELNDGEAILTDQLVGRRAYANIGSREYKGEHYPEVSLDSDAPYCGYWPIDFESPGITEDLDAPF